jgi:hypothetical protein
MLNVLTNQQPKGEILVLKYTPPLALFWKWKFIFLRKKMLPRKCIIFP